MDQPESQISQLMFQVFAGHDLQILFIHCSFLFVCLIGFFLDLPLPLILSQVTQFPHISLEHTVQHAAKFLTNSTLGISLLQKYYFCAFIYDVFSACISTFTLALLSLMENFTFHPPQPSCEIKIFPNFFIQNAPRLPANLLQQKLFPTNLMPSKDP